MRRSELDLAGSARCSFVKSMAEATNNIKKANFACGGEENVYENLAFQLQDRGDKSAFEAKATVDPLYSKWAPKVEAELAAMRTKGQNVDREVLMDYLIGKNARENRQQTAGRQRVEAIMDANVTEAEPLGALLAAELQRRGAVV